MKVLDKVWWYTNRLRSMSAPEIRHRVEEYQIKRRERRESTVYKHRLTTTTPHKQGSHKRVTSAPSPSIPFSHNLLPRTLSFYAVAEISATKLAESTVMATIAKADQLLDHKIEIFGHELALGPIINWHADPLTECIWPRNFYADVDTRDGRNDWRGEMGLGAESPPPSSDTRQSLSLVG